MQHSRGASEFLTTANELDAVQSKIVSFIERRVTAAGARGVVIAMSGGIDSTLTAMLAAEALGSSRVLGLGLPYSEVDGYHMTDARTIAEGIDIEFRQVQLQPVLGMFEDVVAPAIDTEVSSRVIGNVVARLRMIAAYYAANTQSRLVVGTANRSELLLGYFTKYGDGAADLYPLGNLYKTEVRRLAGTTGVPRRIIEKDPTAGLEAGQTDVADIGATYDVIDPLLRRVVDYGESADETADVLSIEPELATTIVAMCADTRHKRTVPPAPAVGVWGDERPSPPIDLSEQLRRSSATGR